MTATFTVNETLKTVFVDRYSDRCDDATTSQEEPGYVKVQSPLPHTPKGPKK